MSNIIILITIIGVSMLVFQFYFLIDKKHFLLTFKYSNIIIKVLLFLSFIFGLASIILALLYKDITLPREVVFVLGGLIVVFSLLSLLSKALWNKNSNKYDIVLLQKDEYKIVSTSSLVGGIEMVRNYLVTTINGEEKTILFNGIAPKGDKDIYIKYYVSDEDKDVLVANTYMNAKPTKFEVFDFILTMYVLGLFIYGLYSMCSYSGGFPIPEKINISFPYNGCPLGIGYFIFRFAFLSTKNGENSFVKFLHYIFMIFYLLLVAEVIIAPFI